MALFTHNLEKIKDTADKNGNIDGTCKRGIKSEHVWRYLRGDFFPEDGE